MNQGYDHCHCNEKHVKENSRVHIVRLSHKSFQAYFMNLYEEINSCVNDSYQDNEGKWISLLIFMTLFFDPLKSTNDVWIIGLNILIDIVSDIDLPSVEYEAAKHEVMVDKSYQMEVKT